MNLAKKFSILAAGLVLLAAGCGRPGKESAPISSLADMRGRTMGFLSGACYRELTEAKQPGINYVPFNDVPSSIVALTTGRVDGVPLDEPLARYWVAHNPGTVRLVEVYTRDGYAFAFRKGNPLRDEFTAVIRRLTADGTLDRYNRKWCDAADPDLEFDELPSQPGHTGARGTLRMIIAPDLEPTGYVVRGRVVGLEPEIARRIAWELDMRLEFISASFGALIESVSSGRADFAGSTIVVTEERMRSVDFSEPHYQGGIALLVRGDGKGATDGGGLAVSFRRTFVEEGRWRDIAQGLGRTLAITILAVILGSILAFPVWRLRIARNRVLRTVGNAYVAIMQGTPILVLLMILYYVVFASSTLDGLYIAVFGFALNFAAYAGEMLRTGVAAVPAGQHEAAAALGFGPLESFFRVVFPQALRHVLPVYRGEVIGLLKSTSVVGYISVTDLTKVSDLIRARTYEAFFPLIATAVIYFVFAWLIAWSLGLVERRLNPKSSQ